MADALVRAPLVDQAIAHLRDQQPARAVSAPGYPPNQCSHRTWVSAAPPCVKP